MRTSSVVHGTLGVLLAAVLLLVGCAPSRVTIDRPELPEAFPYHTAEQIQQNLFVPSDTLESFRARASMRIRSPERSGSFSSEVRHRRNDSLYVSVSPGLGIDAARMLVTPDSFFVYDRIQRELTYGSVEMGERMLPLPLESSEIMLNFLGMLRPDDGLHWRVEADEEYYYLISPDEREMYTVDPALWRVVHREVRDGNGELVEERSFGEFDIIDGYFIPRRVELERPQDEMMASIYYRDLTLNPENLSFDLQVSSRARRVPAFQAMGGSAPER